MFCIATVERVFILLEIDSGVCDDDNSLRTWMIVDTIMGLVIFPLAAVSLGIIWRWNMIGPWVVLYGMAKYGFARLVFWIWEWEAFAKYCNKLDAHSTAALVGLLTIIADIICIVFITIAYKMKTEGPQSEKPQLQGDV